jgi:tetratricopeptide (TPR) repeat protein
MKVQASLRNFLFWFGLGLLIAIFSQVINFPLGLIFQNVFFNLILIWLFIYLSVYIHEFGHAIAGWLVGFPIKKITIGLGKNIWKYEIKATSTLIVINNGFQGGLTHIGDVSRDFLRLRFFVFAAGGILMQTLIVWFCMQITVNNLLFNPFLYSLLDLFIYANIFLIIGNLLPYNTNAFGIPRPTDGLLLLTSFFMKEEQITEILLAGKILDGLENLEAKKLEEAEQIFRECISKEPSLLLPKINLSAALIRQQKIDEAIEILTQITTEKEATGVKLALIYNNLAWCYLIKSISDPRALEQADDYSNQALSVNNKIPNLQGTRSCILIEKGELTEGIKILQPMVKINQPVNEMTNSVIGFLYVAYGYYRQEDWNKSSQYWEKIKDNPELQATEYHRLLTHILEQTNNFENL